MAVSINRASRTTGLPDGRFAHRVPDVQQTLGARLRLLREALGWTQFEVSRRSVDDDGNLLRAIEIGHVEVGRNAARTKRIRSGLAQAFGVTEEDLFAYLDGEISLPDFIVRRNNPRRYPRPKGTPAEDNRARYVRAVEMLVDEGYGDTSEVRKAGALARDELDPEEAATLGTFEWAKRIELSLRLMRRAEDPAAGSGVVSRTAPKRGSRAG